MRLASLVLATLCFAFLNTTPAYAQGGNTHPPDEQRLEPYHKHRDTRNGHDHSYPDRGSVIRDLPKGTIGVNYAGVSYRFHDGVWLEPRGPAFIVVAPPIGLIVPNLPAFTTVLAREGQTYLYVNDVYYRPRPDLGGYEVVNDPADTASQAAAETSFTGGQVPGGNAAAPQTPSPQAATPAAMVTAPAVVPAVASATPATGPAVVPLPAASVATTASGVAPGTTGSVAGPTASMHLAAAPATPPIGPPSPTTPSVAASSTTPSAPVLAAMPSASTPNATVAPTAVSASTSQSAKGSKVFIYPKNGQSADQQARDRYDCYRFGVAQSGLDPMRPGTATAANAELQSDFDRAQNACFDARGYTTR